MESLLIKWFGGWALLVIPVLAGIVCSFLIEAIDQYTPESVSGKLITFIVTVVVGILLAFGFSKIVCGWVDTVLIVVLNWAFANLFYKAGGRKIVKAIIGFSFKTINKKIDQ